jgi:hypothetical protein
MRAALAAAGLELAEGDAVDERLAAARRMYEPYVAALSRFLVQPLPAWYYETPRRDNWQSSPWERVPRRPKMDEV